MKRNRTMTVAIAVMLLVCAVFCFASCGDKYSDSEYTGKWKCTEGEAGGVTVRADEILGGFEIELKEDGTAQTTINGETASGEWEPTEKGFKLKADDQELEFSKEGDNVKVDYKGVEITFVKEQKDS